MQLVAKISLCSIALALASLAHAQETTDSRSSLLVYALTADSETINSWSAGVVAGAIGEAYRKSHEQFLTALRSGIDNGSKQQELIHPFACLGVDRGTQDCRRTVRAEGANVLQAIVDAVQREPSRSARVVDLKIIFDGRFFQVPAQLYDLQITDQGQLVRTNEVVATYIRTYSRSLHQDEIQSKRIDEPFTGKVGSKDAQMHFWLAGSTPRLLSELNMSVQQLATLWSATLDPNAVGVMAGDHSNRALLPRVRDVVGKDIKTCKVLHGDFLVAKDLGEFLWLTVPYKQKNLWNNFFIEPRCGFDY